ncbi:MAG: non-canonical purine NTP pyrophosphatase [Planctomycetota bacterium]|nr:non-canonical purine NTP pyrophosphatase [Planctomycetota bacterium]
MILRRLEGVEPSRRTCGFRCVAAVATPCGKSVTFDGSVRGYVTKPRGECGFGYDPIFFYPPYGRTFGEVSLQMKNTVSHRGRAFSKLAEFISVFQGPLLLLGQEVNQ